MRARLHNMRFYQCFFAGLTILGAANAMTVALATSVPSPTPVGVRVTFTAAVSDASGSNQWYRFRVRRLGGDYQMVRDYSPIFTLDWTASKHEGFYEVEVSARDLDTGDVSTSSSLFQF